MPSREEFERTLLDGVHESWREILQCGLRRMCRSYVESLMGAPYWWLPGPAKCLRAFCIPQDQVKVVWMGESPYPRRRSATGYAFEDGRANLMFGGNGNFGGGIDASLRTILKAWFVATRRLEPTCTRKRDIKAMTKQGVVENPTEIFRRGREHGWLWLNAAPGFFITGDNTDKARQVRYWSPVVQGALLSLRDVPGVKSVLIGNLAREEHRDVAPDCIEASHPSDRRGGTAFIGNEELRAFMCDWRRLIEV